MKNLGGRVLKIWQKKTHKGFLFKENAVCVVAGYPLGYPASVLSYRLAYENHAQCYYDLP